MTVAAIVTARGGSKGLPDKNLRTLRGKTLVARAVESAQNSEGIDRVILTSDAEAILAEGRALGCELITRPPELATDTSRSADAVVHAARAAGLKASDVIVLLQPTSPLRTSHDISECLELFLSGSFRSVVQVTPADSSEVLKAMILGPEGPHPVLSWDALESPRQELPTCVRPTGGVYVISLDEIERTGRFIVPPPGLQQIPPERAIDIDTDADLASADRYLQGGS